MKSSLLLSKKRKKNYQSIIYGCIAFMIAGCLSSHVSYAQNCGPAKVYICHKGKNTLYVSCNAVAAHLAHGDQLGQCNSTPPCSVVGNGGKITCTNRSVVLSATSSSTGVTITWTGPNGFTSTLAAPTVTVPGIYTVSASGDGCGTATDTALVSQDISIPTVTTTGGTITCLTPSVTLRAPSSITGLRYQWSGPNNFLSASPTPIVSVAGIYSLTVTNPANGCSFTTTAAVTQNTAAPQVTATGGTLTCIHPTITISASSTVSGATFSWTGPNGFSSISATPVVSIPGTYVVTATNPANGCMASTAAVVQQNNIAPTILTVQASRSGTITCANPSVVLTATTTSTNVIYRWTGPNNFVSDSAMPVVTEPGIYSLNLSNAANGCASTASVEVRRNVTAPVNVTTNPALLGTLTCREPSLVLSAGSSTAGVAYNWTGPNGFNSPFRVTNATLPGIYTVTVTDTVNGCGSSASVVVEQNIATPTGVTASNTEPLTCFTTEVALSGSSSSPAVSYAWAGPNGFSSSLPATTTTAPGVYTLTVTDLINGCTSTATTTVLQDIAAPANVTATNSGPLTCSNTTVSLTGSSSTQGVEYNWFGPDGFFAPSAVSSTSTPGDYVLMVTNLANGCSTTEFTMVEDSRQDCMGKMKKTANNHEAQAKTTEKSFAYTTYPNPARGKVFVNFSSPELATVTVSLYKDNGVKELLLFNNKVNAGTANQLDFDTTKLSKGLHLLVIQVNNKTYTKKVIVIH